MGNHHVATLSADKYDDVESVVERLRGALENRFGVPTMVEAHYPHWSVSAELSSRDPAPATVAAWAKDWLFDLDPSASVRRGLVTPRSRSKELAVNKSNAQLEREIKSAMRGPVSHAQRLTDEEIQVVNDLARSATDLMRRTRARLVQHELLLAGEADVYEEGEGAGHRRKAWAMARPLFARR